MTNHRGQGAALTIDVLKAARDGWHTRDEIVTISGVSRPTVLAYVDVLVEGGMLDERQRKAGPINGGNTPTEYRVAAAWRNSPSLIPEAA
jgi:hypothetical protein